MLHVGSPGSSLLDLSRGAYGELLIVAPFIKRQTLARLLNETAPQVRISVITRWHLPEIMSGVSDLDVWPLLRERGAKLHLAQRLHAKVYASESDVLVGSANLTGAALGWSLQPNDEVLVHPAAEEAAAVRAFVAALVHRSIEVDDRLHSRYVEMIAGLPPFQLAEVLAEAEAGSEALAKRAWLPESRDPMDVERLYAGDFTKLTRAARGDAARDLAALEAPPGLAPEVLRAHVNLQLHQHPLVRQLSDLLRERRRFGEVARIVGAWGDLDREDAARSWQTLMRWLLHFQSTDWVYGKPRHSEILMCVKPWPTAEAPSER